MSRLSRQSFLGPNSDAILDAATVGIVGLSGGGSHMAQQLAHLGVGGFVLSDPQHIEETNTNRLVGGTLADVRKKTPKIEIAERVIRGLQPNARIVSVRGPWTAATEHFKGCDIILGALDSFKEREQLERFARRHLIPYVDVGMSVRDFGGNFLVSGQVILSMPESPCLRCCGFITDTRLEEEAELYGAAGPRPQVVWSNGMLASIAVGIAVQLLTPWFSNPSTFNYLEYDGNKGTVTKSAWVDQLEGHTCPHHPQDETGDPFFDIRVHLVRVSGESANSFLDGARRLWRSLLKWLPSGH